MYKYSPYRLVFIQDKSSRYTLGSINNQTKQSQYYVLQYHAINKNFLYEVQVATERRNISYRVHG